jgi:hypothetical protein
MIFVFQFVEGRRREEFSGGAVVGQSGEAGAQEPGKGVISSKEG